MSSLSTLPKGDSAWLLRKAIERIMEQVSVLETNIGVSTSGNSANTQIIFNDAGTLRGDPDLTFNTALNKLVATNLESTTALVVGTTATITGALTLSAGTVNGVGYLNASKVLTAGSALVFDGTNLGIGGTGQLRFATSGGAIGDNSIGTENSFSMMLRCGRGSTSNIELASDKLVFSTSASERYKIDSTGIATWSNVGGVAGTAMTLNANGLGVGVSPSYNIHARGATDGRIQVEGASGFGMVFIQASSGNTAQLQLNSSGGSGRRYVVSSNSSGQFSIGDETAVVSRLVIDASGNVGIGVITPSYKLDTYTTLQGAVTAKQFANRTANKILVKRFFGITADTVLFSVECGTAGAGAMAAFEINVFATGQKSGSSSDRQFYGKWYVTRNLAGTFTITSAFSSGSSGAFTVTASGTSLNVNGIFSVISDGSACVEVTGYIGGRDTVVETALNVTMP